MAGHAARALDAGDHGSVILGVREHDPARHAAQDGGQRRLVGHEARIEQQCRLLAVQLGQLGLQRVVQGGRTADVARAAGAGPMRLCSGAGRLDGDGGATHRQVVVGRPHQDVARHAVLRPGIIRESLGLARQWREGPIPALATDVSQRTAALVQERVHGHLY